MAVKIEGYGQKIKKSPGLTLSGWSLIFRRVFYIDTIVDKSFPDHSGCSVEILILFLHG